MLTRLEIKNFLTIERISLDFDKNITAIIGESGAGKSLILKAVDTVFAQKSQTDIIGSFDSKSSIKLFFKLSQKQRKMLSDYSIDDDEIVIEKIIQPKKTRSYINHEPITARTLSQIERFLINMISQNYRFEAFESDNITNILDEAIDKTVYDDFLKTYEDYLRIKSDFEEILSKIEQINKNHPEILLESINKINPKQGEYEELLQKSKRIKSLSFVKSKISDMIEFLYENDNNFEAKIAEFNDSIEKIGSLGFDVTELQTLFKNIQESVSSSKYILYDIIDNNYESDDIDSIESRLFELEELQRKFSKTVDEIIQERERLLNMIDEKDKLQQKLNNLKVELEKKENSLTQKADYLTNERKKAADIISRQIKKFLNKLMMENSIVEFVFHKKAISKNGQDNIEIFFSANPDIKADKIDKTASGGERSRFILSMKCAYSSIDNNAETLILDEIESGISNKTLDKMSEVIKELSKTNQIILITHNESLSNIANTVYAIEKEFDGKNTKSFANIVKQP